VEPPFSFAVIGEGYCIKASKLRLFWPEFNCPETGRQIELDPELVYASGPFSAA
jgi:hypothetical protein